MATSPLPRDPAPQGGRKTEHPADSIDPHPLAVVLQRDELERSGWGHRLPARHIRQGTEPATEQEA